MKITKYTFSRAKDENKREKKQYKRTFKKLKPARHRENVEYFMYTRLSSYLSNIMSSSRVYVVRVFYFVESLHRYSVRTELLTRAVDFQFFCAIHIEKKLRNEMSYE